MEVKNSEEIDSWLWHHAQVLGNQCDSIKNEDGLNIAWEDTIANERIDIIYEV